MASVTYGSLVQEIQSGIFRPVYYLMGEETYYNDQLTDLLSTSILTESEREFNQLTIYGQDTTIDAIIANARRFPMMANHVVLIIKEAQNIKEINKLTLYLEKPLESTILVFSHKNGSLNKKTSQKLITQIEARGGVVFESKLLDESKDGAKLYSFISGYLQSRNLGIEDKAISMLIEAVGGNLSRLASEMDKLVINSGQTHGLITPEMVEMFTGISKEYNLNELQNALANKNSKKVYRIVKFMEENPKNYPLQRILPALFMYYSNLMLAYYAPRRDVKGLEDFFHSKYRVMDYVDGLRNYSAFKVLDIIDAFRRYDGMGKGVGTTANMTKEGFLREFIYFVLH